MVLKNGGRYGDEQLKILFIKGDPNRSHSFADSLLPAISTVGLGEKVVDWSPRQMPLSVDVAYDRLALLSDEELPRAVISILTRFGPPPVGEEVDDIRTQQEKDVYQFVHNIVTAPDSTLLVTGEKRIKRVIDILKQSAAINFLINKRQKEELTFDSKAHHNVTE